MSKMNGKVDPIAMLKKDHQKVKGLLEELTRTTDRAAKHRQELLAEIETEIKVHMALEEQLFYPAFKQAAKTKDDEAKYYEAVEEHHAADTVLKDLMDADPAGPTFAGKAKVLKELILHHAKEEEKSMFPKAKKLISKDELNDLGKRMMQKKQELVEHAEAAE